MKRILLALGLAILGTASAFAQSVGMPSVGGYWSTTACGTGPSPCFVQYGSSVPTGGNVAAGATDSGNPVKVGGVYNLTAPTYTSGQRGNLELTNKGETIVRLSASGALIQAGNPSDALANGVQVYQTNSLTSVYNGTTWDRQFACTSQASATITAGATTEVVALTASQIIRVCSFTIGMSASGTAKFVQGTGTNCGTGTADIMPATQISTGNVLALSGGNSSVLRTSSGSALCVTAATGNAQVYVNYAKY
jgi:hypothetical protein